MAITTSTKKWISFVYDFNTDGGAVSVKDMGVFLPSNSIIWFGYAKVITTCLGGAGAKISVGYTGFSEALVTETAVASWTAGAILPGLNLLRTPLSTDTVQLQMAIVTAGLTAGKFVYGCMYSTFNGSNVGPLPTAQGIGFDIIGSTLIVY